MLSDQEQRFIAQEALTHAEEWVAGLPPVQRAAINRQAAVLRAVLAAGGEAASAALMLVGAEHAARQTGMTEGVTWH